MKEVLHPTTLPDPDNFPRDIIGVPTRNRWGDIGNPGHLPEMISSVQHVLAQDGTAGNTIMLVSDASNGEYGAALPQIRERWMRELDTKPTSEIFLMTADLQHRVAKDIAIRTKIEPEIVRAILDRPTYDTQRTKIDAVIAGAVTQTGRTFRFWGGDDDVQVPLQMRILKPEVLDELGFYGDPNSYILWIGQPLASHAFTEKPNSLKPFFDPLGKTIYQLRRDYGGVHVSEDWTDQMHVAMEQARGNSVIFHVTHGVDEEPANGDEWRVISVINTKTRLPDPRTFTYVQQVLRNGLEPAEQKIFAYIAGPPDLFAIRKAFYKGGPTNVDSANMSWHFDPDTAFILRWFVSDPEISNRNHIVNGQYRSDNEYLTELLEVLSTEAGKQYAYLSGVEAEVEHHRAQTGYRPNDPSEQAASSLIGNIAALASLERIEFDAYGTAKLNLQTRYVVPEEKAKGVFDKMKGLETICADKIRALEDEYMRNPHPDLLSLKARYQAVSQSIHTRLSAFQFPRFYALLNKEVNEQLAFTDKILRAYPRVIEEVGKLISEGKYPVLRYVPVRERGTNYPQTKR